MNEEISIKLINNIAFLLSLSVFNHIGNLIYRAQGRIKQFFNGVTIGMIGVAIIMVPIVETSMYRFDTRSILIGASAIVFGFLPTIIGAIISSMYYITINGFQWIDLCMITSTMALGLFWRRHIIPKQGKSKIISVYAFGVFSHFLVLSCLFILPFEQAFEIVQSVSLKMMVLFPLGTLALTLLLMSQNDLNEVHLRAIEADLQFRDLFENNDAVMLLIDPKTGKIKDANQAATRFYGWNRKELLKMNMNQINVMDVEKIKSELEKKKNEKRVYFEFQHKKADGSYADIEEYTGPIRKYGNHLLYSIIHDVTERVRTRRELVESEAQFRTLVDRAPFAIFIVIDYHIVFLNDSAYSLLGTFESKDIKGSLFQDRIHPQSRTTVRDWITSVYQNDPEIPMIELEFLKMDQSIVGCKAIAVTVNFENKTGALLFVTDVSKEKELEKLKLEFEAQMRQQQKLESIGILAGGVAHEINNPLGGILNYAQLVYDQLDATSETADYMNEIIRETERISRIVRNLLQFSRMEKQSHSLARIDDIIEDTLSLMRSVLRKDHIDLVISIEKEIPKVKCRSQQIQQVIMNLITNSRDALNERYGESVDKKKIMLNCSLKSVEDENWVSISVSDNGCGISDDVQKKMFDPFFSTKPKDKGTGLGLSISYGIMKDHKGQINCRSKINEGTEFTLLLPIDNGWQMEDIYE